MLLRDAPLLQKYPALSQERRKILSTLALLVSQAKKASEDFFDDTSQELEIDAMIMQAGQVFARVKSFLTVAAQCGVVLPDRRPSTPARRSSEEDDDGLLRPSPDATPERPNSRSGFGHHRRISFDKPSASPKGPRQQLRTSVYSTSSQTKSLTDVRLGRGSISEEQDPEPPSMPVSKLSVSSQPQVNQALPGPRVRQPTGSTHISSSSVSSLSSFESMNSPARPPFPEGPCTTMQVMEALRYTHDQYLSTIAAFIGHAHSYSRLSHASSTGHMYDLVREIIEMVCKLLTIVEAVLSHPDVPFVRLGNLKIAKEGLYAVTSQLAESVRMLNSPLPPNMTDEEEKQRLLRSATGALKAGADCVSAIKMCITRSSGERPFVLQVPSVSDSNPFTAGNLPSTPSLEKSLVLEEQPEDEGESTIMPQDIPRILGLISGIPSPSGSDSSASMSKFTTRSSGETAFTTPDGSAAGEAVHPPTGGSPTSVAFSNDDATTWEGSIHRAPLKPLPSAPHLPLEPVRGAVDPNAWIHNHDYQPDEIALNGDGLIVGGTLNALVEKMTPHGSIVDPAFSAVFFMTFRYFCKPTELVEAIIVRYNVKPPVAILNDDEALQLWQQQKGVPVRLRVSNLVKSWVESYWRHSVDNEVIPSLSNFTVDGIGKMFPHPAAKILEMLQRRSEETADTAFNPKVDRSKDPGLAINPPSVAPSEIPRPTMTKALLSALRSKNFSAISIMDFDALELSRQLTIMECRLYCEVDAEEVLETGQEGAKFPVNVRAVSTLSTRITGWVTESILNEPDPKKRVILIKFFIKVSAVCLCFF
jgi:son of sevenless